MVKSKYSVSKLWFINLTLAFIFIILFYSPNSFSKKITYKKTQEVDFSEMSLKGTVRNPEGAYLVQKRGIKFLPLYEIQKDMDQKIRDSIQYTH